jgi:DNA invertase Pin-like site-specific DNA recombinase
MDGMLAVLAEYERELIRERTIAGLAEARPVVENGRLHKRAFLFRFSEGYERYRISRQLSPSVMINDHLCRLPQRIISDC